jgi:uncharacterized phage protein gp47/JayE
VAASPFQKSFDEILDDILTDFRNIFPDVDVAVGSLAYMKAAGYASALWGLYRYQDWISKQIFPDSADTEYLERHAWVRGLSRVTGESDRELAARLLEYIRRPPAGGNKYDYVKWALEIDNVASAYSIPMGQGLGTVDVVILSDAETTGSEIPDADLLTTVRDHIVDVCPTAVKYVRVLAPATITQDIAMTVTGSAANTERIAADVAAYVASLTPGQDLYRARLINIAVANGAEDVDLTEPAANVAATDYQLIRPGVVSVE